jgi:predicted HicB family RNase H-like nuclease
MSKAPSTPKEPHRSFTVRVPESIYAKLGDMAHADGMHVNGKVNQLLRLGMGEHVSLDAAVARLIKREVTDVL